MKKLFAAILSLVLVLSLSTAFAGEKLSVIATENPHAEILELVKDDLAALGYDLDLTIATDYVIENPATAAGDVMANFFQHLPYLAQYNGSVSEAEQLVPVIYTHFEPMAIYAGTKSSLDDIADGKRKWQTVIDNFYQPFSKTLGEKHEELSKKEIAPVKGQLFCSFTGYKRRATVCFNCVFANRLLA